MLRFSPSQLNLVNECPRCFWYAHVGGIPRPRGIFPGIMGAIDRLIQGETAKFAGKGKPKWLLPWTSEGVVRPGSKRLMMKRGEYSVTGMYDELVIMDDESVVIVDYKTAASPHSEAATKKYYQLQLDMYALLCEANNLKPADVGYIAYTTPDLLRRYVQDFNLGHMIDIFFKVTHVPIKVSASRARETIAWALEICMKTEAPIATQECEWCRYRGAKT